MTVKYPNNKTLTIGDAEIKVRPYLKLSEKETILAVLSEEQKEFDLTYLKYSMYAKILGLITNIEDFNKGEMTTDELDVWIASGKVNMIIHKAGLDDTVNDLWAEFLVIYQTNEFNKTLNSLIESINSVSKTVNDEVDNVLSGMSQDVSQKLVEGLYKARDEYQSKNERK